MSKETVKKMFAKLQTDSGLLKQFEETVKKHGSDTENTLAEKLIDFGKNSGFSFSKDDLMAARAELVDSINENSELKDSDLEKVAGGNQLHKAATLVTTIVGLGVSCLVISVVGAIVYSEGSGCRTMTVAIECLK